ncbi:cupin 2 conserved barrel domain protein [Leptolyngbya sp. Heron Island J]|uniref:cupin domain-containing protein n=1 Tax=Leptolyngbya sp. Heron Island J TaxID=1385935 RepID=UPI0003B9BC99|nr:cupin domain-containing protein [Leptolyngbya sp. Heron Island J]ESA33099.1 cupin 2 conserved barrel domain protein [Leptolyngbya sp. Heron Island J]
MIIDLTQVPTSQGTSYPQPFKAAVAGRARQRVGNAAGLTNFGVNLTTLAPGAQSALRHWHSRQDEFIYVVSGELSLVTDAGETVLTSGMMAGFPAGIADGHHLINRSDAIATYLEIGDRTPADQAEYPDDDLLALPKPEGGYYFAHRNGQPY